jgi:hypothetical protein
VRLAQKLFEKGTMLTGTVRHNSREFPKDFSPRLAPQTCEYKLRNNVLACAFSDKVSQEKPVLLLPTGSVAVNYEHMVRDQQRMKPAMVLQYNRGMGVDLSGRKIHQIASERPVQRYWINVVRNLIGVA